MDLGLDGRAALVLGGTAGLAFSAARFLAGEGVKIAVNGRDPERGRTAVHRLGNWASYIRGDVSVRADRERIHQEAVAAVGPIEILITNAGGPPPGRFAEHGHDKWIQAMETNVMAAVEVAQMCLPAMIEAGFGRIVNVTSFAVREPYPNMALSNTVRAALTGAMATLAREVMEHGVTVNNVLPGLMDTGALMRVYEARSAREGISEEEVKSRMAQAVPAKRLGTADDFGPVCAFLCSPLAGYITAQNVTVDGGLVRGLL